MQDDALLDLGPHLIDLARWLTASEIMRARAHTVQERHAEFELDLKRGHVAISCSNNSPYRECVGVKDALGDLNVSYRRGGLLSGIVARLRLHQDNPLVTSLRGQLEAFGHAVAGIGGESPLATTADGLAVMSAIEALRCSARQGGVECSLQVLHQAD
jgi:predicted dehydrogenase